MTDEEAIALALGAAGFLLILAAAFSLEPEARVTYGFIGGSALAWSIVETYRAARKGRK